MDIYQTLLTGFEPVPENVGERQTAGIISQTRITRFSLHIKSTIHIPHPQVRWLGGGRYWTCMPLQVIIVGHEIFFPKRKPPISSQRSEDRIEQIPAAFAVFHSLHIFIFISPLSLNSMPASQSSSGRRE